MGVSNLRLNPSTSSMVSGRGLLAVSGSSRVRTEPSRGHRPHSTMGACGLILLRKYIIGARTPPVRAHMEPMPIPFCLWLTGSWEYRNKERDLDPEGQHNQFYWVSFMTAHLLTTVKTWDYIVYLFWSLSATKQKIYYACAVWCRHASGRWVKNHILL